MLGAGVRDHGHLGHEVFERREGALLGAALDELRRDATVSVGRLHHALASNTFVEDKETGELKRPHHVDLKTGMYKGRQVLTPKED